MALEIQVVRLDADLPLPTYATEGDAGLDLYSAENLSLAAGQRAMVPTGIAVAIPSGFVGLIHPRSGLAWKHGVGMVNAPGTIDAGYRGEIKVLLINHDLTETFEIRRGERIAQLVIQAVERATLVEVSELSSTERGAQGFGSTGTGVLQ